MSLDIVQDRNTIVRQQSPNRMTAYQTSVVTSNDYHARSNTITSLQETERQQSFKGGHFLSSQGMTSLLPSSNTNNQTAGLPIFQSSNANNSKNMAQLNNSKPMSHTSNNSQKQAARVDRVKQCVENNDMETFRVLMLSRKEYLNMRFQYGMNLL